MIIKETLKPVLAFLLVSILAGLSSCTIQKRCYRSGYSIEWNTKKPKASQATAPTREYITCLHTLNTEKISLVGPEKENHVLKTVESTAVGKRNPQHYVYLKDSKSNEFELTPQTKEYTRQATEKDNTDENWLITAGACGDLGLIIILVFTSTLAFAWLWVGLGLFLAGGIFIGIGAHVEGHDAGIAAGIIYLIYMIYVPFYLIFLLIRGIVRLCKHKSKTPPIPSAPQN